MRGKKIVIAVSLILALLFTGCNLNMGDSPVPSVESSSETQSNESDAISTSETDEEALEVSSYSDSKESKPDNSSESESSVDQREEDEQRKAEEEAQKKAEEEKLRKAEEARLAAEEAERKALKDKLDKAQKNSIAMLNYLAVLSQEINSSKNSRLFLEEAYSALINNTNPEEVNELTESHLASLLDIIEKYRLITVKRDRLQYIYEQNKAQALKEAVPNPLGLLSAVSSFDFKRLAASAIYMAVDSYSSYKAYNDEIDSQFLQDGWELDDEEAENVHESRKRAFMFMIDIVREENLPGALALNEASVEKYVTWKNETNIDQKIQFFEDQEKTYEAFGDYWLTRASCYYDHEEYEKCLECFDKYEKMQANIFRKDYNFAKALPIAIVAAKKVNSKETYIPAAERYLKILVDNTENTEWSLKYFAAQMYMDLYAQTNDKKYLDCAFSLALNNVNNLVAEQKKMNSIYLSPVREVSLPLDPTKDASKDVKAGIKEEKEIIKKYNEGLKEKRKTELPPVYEPLVLNCELLFGLAEIRGISSSEEKRIEGILHEGGADLFLSEPLDKRYTFSPNEFEVEAQFEKDSITLPAICVSETSFIRVTVTEAGIESKYEDWLVKKVDRKAENVDSFIAIYTSKDITKQEWSADSSVKIEIFDEKKSNKSPYVLRFKVKQYRKIPVLPDTVKFEQV